MPPLRHPSLGESAKASLLHKMLSSIAYCHRHGVVHRDIKLENFVFDTVEPDAELKLIDFGMAVRVKPGEDVFEDGMSTMLYMAPEMFWVWHEERGTPDVPYGGVLYTSAVDVWALGVVAYQLLFGNLPFGLDPQEDEEESGDRIVFEPLEFPPSASAGSRSFVSALLEKDAAKRPNAEAAMRHEWIVQHSALRAGAGGGGAAAADDELEWHKSVVKSLEEFSRASTLQKHARHALAFNAPTTAVRRLRDAFIGLDADDSGTMSLAEFRAVLSRHPDAVDGVGVAG